MSLSDDEILERGTQGIFAFSDMSLSDDRILKRGTKLWSKSWGHVPNWDVTSFFHSFQWNEYIKHWDQWL